ncbi:MAG: PH domain-containing protein [Planctomycetaceae bacterium]|jgi:hypothetical protein|nr:PH domain-containing protein [Planctomycetaceae bacterium]
MGLFTGMLGLSSEVDEKRVEAELAKLLAPNETVELAYQLVRDLTVLTNRRIILVDKQGITGKRIEYVSIPYRSIVKFAIETVGHFDIDADITLHLSDHLDPVKLELRRSGDVSEMMKLIANNVC